MTVKDAPVRSMSIKALADNLARKIDAKLPKQPKAGNKIIYPFDFDNSPNEGLRKEIIRRYSELGWKVTFQPDERDGDYFTFSCDGGPSPKLQEKITRLLASEGWNVVTFHADSEDGHSIKFHKK